MGLEPISAAGTSQLGQTEVVDLFEFRLWLCFRCKNPDHVTARTVGDRLVETTLCCSFNRLSPDVGMRSCSQFEAIERFNELWMSSFRRECRC